MIILKFCKHWEYTKIMESKERCQGRFCNKGRKYENSPNLPLGSLKVFIVENQAQNFKCIMNKRLMVLWLGVCKKLTNPPNSTQLAELGQFLGHGGLGWVTKFFFYSGLGWVWVIKLQTRQTRPDPPIF